MGIHPATAGRLVTGNIRMSVTTLIDASEILGVEPCQLITGRFDTARCAGGDQ